MLELKSVASLSYKSFIVMCRKALLRPPARYSEIFMKAKGKHLFIHVYTCAMIPLTVWYFTLALHTFLFTLQLPVVGGCLDSNALWLYIVKFNDSLFHNVSTTTSTSYSLTSVKEGIGLEITITPTLPFVQLTGPPLSMTVNLSEIGTHQMHN